MKIAIYTIALNEEANAEKFMKSCEQADYVVVGDTGSKDKTVEIITDFSGTVVPINVRPWRFDVARNAVMALLPLEIDLCIALDLDETFTPGWRDLLETYWRPGVHDRLAFRYIHDFKPDGSYGIVGMRSHSHSRENYIWEHVVHEELRYTGPRENETVLSLTDLVVEHRQDCSKSRDGYLPLLELECHQVNTTPRHIFWLIREYSFRANWGKVLEWADRFFTHKNVWNVEVAHTHCLKAAAFNGTGDTAKALTEYLAAVQAAPKEREPWLSLAQFHAEHADWAQAYGAAVQAMAISNRPEHYLAGNHAWGHTLYELAAIAADHMGMTDVAKKHIQTAMQISPDNEYLRQTAKNLALLK
jgi:glycosyltransferase involved in cell wall biosynthesis